jgi:putative NADH-flavin reductase
MRLAIFGATGRTGRHLVSWAADNGHSVTALARDPGQPGLPPGLAVTRGDALDAAAVAEVIDGADAVLSALGPRGAKTPGLLARAAANIVSAMAKTGVRRLICLSAAGPYITQDPDQNRVMKLILPRILAKPFADVRAMEDVISATDLDWTLVRATRLVNGPVTGRYRVSPDYPPRGGGKIARADLAHFMTVTLTEDAWIRSAPALGY